MQESKNVWLDGKFVARSDASCSLASPSLTNGMVVLEDVPCFEGPAGAFAFRVGDHVRQFLRSAKIARMGVPFTADKLQGAVVKTAAESGLSRGIVRMVALYAAAPAAGQSLETSVAMYCVPVSAPETAPVSACVSSWRAVSSNALPPQALMAASHANAEFALHDARSCGFDQAVLLNEAGMVSSGAGATLFAVRDGVLSTPPIACGVRESVERDTIINFAMDLDVPIVEELMTRSDLAVADEVFFSDALAGVLPVAAIDGCAIGMPGKREKLAGPDGRGNATVKVGVADRFAPGPITKAIAERFVKMRDGKLDEYTAWATPIG